MILEKYIDQYYSKGEEAQQAATEIEGFNVDEEIVEEDLEIKNAPVVRLIDSIISQAIKTRTSDIHIEPFEKSCSCFVSGLTGPWWKTCS